MPKGEAGQTVSCAQPWVPGLKGLVLAAKGDVRFIEASFMEEAVLISPEISTLAGVITKI
jgi:hypothetical protein